MIHTQEGTPNIRSWYIYLINLNAYKLVILQCPATVLSLSDNRICWHAKFHASNDGGSTIISDDISWKVEECGVLYYHAERGIKFDFLTYVWERMIVD